MNALRWIFNRRSSGKESVMGDTNTTATPPAASGGIDTEALAKAVGAALVTALPAALAEANKPLVEQLSKLQAKEADTATTSKGAGNGQQALTLDQVEKLLNDKLGQQQQSARLQAEREAYQRSKLSDLPEIYRSQLGNDPSKWAEEEQRIRQAYQADFKAAGGKVADVAGTAATTATADTPLTQTVDTSKLSPLEKIQLGMKKAAAAGATSAAAPPATK